MSGIQTTIKIEGLEEFQKRLGNSGILTSELKSAEHGALRVIRDRARADASTFSTVLPQSIRIEPQPGGLVGIIGSVAKTAVSIAEGRKVGDAPSIDAIIRWMQHRGNTFSVLTRRAVRHRQTALSRQLAAEEKGSLRGEAIIIQRQIRDVGTKPLPFVIPAARETATQVEAIFRDHINRALRRLAGK